MSHWKKFKTNVLENPNRNILQNALQEMGLSYDTAINSIRNSWGHESVDAALVKDGKTLALGFNFKQDGKNEILELSGDFFGTGLSESKFMNMLAQTYQKINITQKLRNQMWDVDNITTQNDGSIVINAHQWA